MFDYTVYGLPTNASWNNSCGELAKNHAKFANCLKTNGCLILFSFARIYFSSCCRYLCRQVKSGLVIKTKNVDH